MKKNIKKLMIHKETLRHLEETRALAPGAAMNKTPLSCDGTCGFDTCRCWTGPDYC